MDILVNKYSFFLRTGQGNKWSCLMITNQKVLFAFKWTCNSLSVVYSAGVNETREMQLVVK